MADEATIIGVTAGMYSGVNWLPMIDQLVAIEGRRIRIWEANKAEYKLEQDAWRDVNMRFSNLKDRSYDLLQDSTWEQVSIASSDEDYVTATDAGGAVAGNYSFRIRQLATASTLVSGGAGGINTHDNRMSRNEVMSGPDTVNLTTTSNPWSQFDVTITGQITITLSDNTTWTSLPINNTNYSTVQSLIDAVNRSGIDILMRYHRETDRFSIESTNTGKTLATLSQTVTNGFWTQTKIPPFVGIGGGDSPAAIGVDASANLSAANFDETLSASGSFRVNGETISWTGSNTLNGIMSAINTSAAGVSAFYDESLDKVVLTTKDTGADRINVADTTGNLINVLDLQYTNSKFAGDEGVSTAAQSAIFTINSANSSHQIRKSSNTFTMAGTTFTLKKTNVSSPHRDGEYAAATPITVTVAQDISAVKTSIKDWVGQWNSAMTFLKSKMRYDSASEKAGELTGDGTAMGIQQRVYALTTDRYNANPPNLAVDLRQLAHIGITLGAFNSGNEGELVIDNAILTRALTNRLQGVEDLFGVDKARGRVKDYGVAYEMYRYTDNLTKSDGIIANRIDLYSNTNKTGLMDIIDRQIKDYQEYLEEYEKNLRAEFEAMEMAMAQMQAQLNILMGYFGT